MSQRLRITRSMQEENAEQALTLEECKQYFAAKSGFSYSQVYTVQGAESAMSIEGDFFMWSHEGAEYPFRLYMGDLYVALSMEAIVPVILEIATDLQADVVEG